MLFHLLVRRHVKFPFFNVSKYITFRTFGASITSVLICLLMGPWYIRLLQRKQMGQAIRGDGPKSHLVKKGTPTMGGGLFLLGIVVPTLVWSDLTNKRIWIALITTLLFGVVGYIDDYRKVIQKDPKGLTGKQKLIA